MIVVLGASGFVGARLFFDLAKENEIVGTRYSDNFSDTQLRKLDITDTAALNRFLDDTNPTTIIHAANNPSSSWCKENPLMAKKLNIDATKAVLEFMAPTAKLIYISTMGAIEPSNYYQETKRASEEIIIGSGKEYVILRPSIGFGVSPNRAKQNNSNNIVTAVGSSTPTSFDTSLICQPTSLGHMSELIKKILMSNIRNITIPVSVEVEKSLYEIATDVLKSFNKTVFPVDMKKPKFNSVNNIDSLLTELGLPTLSYESFIRNFVEEIENRASYILK